MQLKLLKHLLKDIHNIQIAVYGDFCLDAYWILDPEGGEISVETNLKAEAVRRQYYNLGGASNVVANLAALAPAKIRLAGVIGDDIFGREMLQQFSQLDVDAARLIRQKDNYDTVVFAKRYLDKQEQPRIDFGFFNQRTAATDEAIIQSLYELLSDSDALIFNQQVPGVLSRHFIEMANKLFEDFNDKVIVLDSRHYGEQFKNMYRKTNNIEAAQLLGLVPEEQLSQAQIFEMGRTLFEQFHKPVFLTLGADGILTLDERGANHIPGIMFGSQLDTVGAGDTVMSALTAALGAGYEPAVAAEFANLAAGVTVQKLFQTGTATGEEIIALNETARFGKQLSPP